MTSMISAVLLYVAFGYLEGAPQYVVLLCLGITIIMFVPAGVAVTQDVVHPGLRAVSLSINIVIQHTLGSPLGPLFVGMVSDRYELVTAFKILPLFCLLAGLLFWIGAIFYNDDLQSVDDLDVLMEAA